MQYTQMLKKIAFRIKNSSNLPSVQPHSATRDNIFIEKLIYPAILLILGGLFSVIQLKISNDESRTKFQAQVMSDKNDKIIHLLELYLKQDELSNVRGQKITLRMLESIDPDFASKIANAINGPDIRQSNDVQEVLGDINYKSNKLKDDKLEKSLPQSIAKDRTAFYIKMANAQLDANLYEVALENYREALKSDPENSAANEKIDEIINKLQEERNSK